MLIQDILLKVKNILFEDNDASCLNIDTKILSISQFEGVERTFRQKLCSLYAS